GLVGGSIARADAAIEAVGSDDKVGAVFFRNRLVIGDIGFEYEFHADFFATSLKDIEQFLAPYPNEPVAAAAQAAALVMNGDIVPMIECVADLDGGHRISLFEIFQCGIRKYHAP